MATQIEKNTAKIMLERLNNQLDELYYKQEAGKLQKEYTKFCHGGRFRKRKGLRKHWDGDPIVSNSLEDPRTLNIGGFSYGQNMPQNMGGIGYTGVLSNMGSIQNNQYGTMLPQVNVTANRIGSNQSTGINSVATPFKGESLTPMQSKSGMSSYTGDTIAHANASYRPLASTGNEKTEPWSPITNSVNRQSARDWWKSDKTQTAIGGIGSAINAGLGLLPSLWNLKQGQQSPETLEYSKYRNRRSDQALGLMADRRYDPTREIQSAGARQNAFRQSASDVMQSSGALMSQLGGAQARYQGDVGNALRGASNINQQYKGDYASMLNQVGEQDANRMFALEDVNARNRAMQKGYTAAGLTGLQQWGLTNEQMKNQKNVDLQRTNILNSMSPWQFDQEKNMSYKVKFGGRLRKQPSLWRKKR
jgi:hypothetical protein